MPRKNPKVIRIRKPLNFSIGMIIFLVFFLYLMFNVASFFLKDRKQIYEVGQISTAVKDTTYDGLILRSEATYTTPKTGYINLYVRENARTSVGNTVYSVDENGAFTELLNTSSAGTSSLDSDQLLTLKKKLSALSASYDPSAFSSVYDAKYGVENLLMTYLSAESMEQLEAIGIDTKYLTTVTAETSGIVEYTEDGMEKLTEDKLTAADFNRSNYSVNSVTPGAMMEQGSFVYKTITSEQWYLYLPLSQEDQDALRDVKKIQLHFNDVNLDVAADFTMITTSDQMVLGKCSLSRYMIQLADRRYTSVTIKKSKMYKIVQKTTNEVEKISLVNTGLKIPKTALVNKDFYIIPEGYATKGSNSDDIGFIRGTFTADGTKADMIYPNIYAHKDGYYYVDSESITAGTVILVPDNPLIQEKTDEELALEAASESAAAQSSEDSTGLTPAPVTESSAQSLTASTEESTAIVINDPGAESTEESTEETEAYNPDMELDGSYDPAAEGQVSDEAVQETVAVADDGSVPLPTAGGNSFTIGDMRPLNGAYCVNKGYAVFKQIEIIDETDDYYIVTSGQSYGLAVYDHILLDGTTAQEGDLIY